MQQLYNITSQLNNQGKPSFCSLLLLPITITGSHLHASPFLLFSSSHSTVCVCVCVCVCVRYANICRLDFTEGTGTSKSETERQTDERTVKQTDRQTDRIQMPYIQYINEVASRAQYRCSTLCCDASTNIPGHTYHISSLCLFLMVTIFCPLTYRGCGHPSFSSSSSLLQ